MYVSVGDIIIGLQAIDENWWQGQIDRNFGLFPLTHVIELAHSTGIINTELAVDSQMKTDSLHDVDNISQSSSQNNVVSQKSDGQIKDMDTTCPSGSSDVLARAKAHSDFTAQLDDELTFQTDDVIEIIEVLDADFANGRSADGRTGQFPLALVDVFEGSISSFVGSQQNRQLKPKFDWWKDPDAAASILTKLDPEQLKDSIVSGPSFEEQTAPIESEDYSLSQIFAQQISEDDGAFESSWHSAFAPGKLVRVLFQFVAENDNELSLLPGDIVHVLAPVDDLWILGEMGTKRGIFPMNFVEPYEDKMPELGHQVLESEVAAAVSPVSRNIVHAECLSLVESIVDSMQVNGSARPLQTSSATDHVTADNGNSVLSVDESVGLQNSIAADVCRSEVASLAVVDSKSTFEVATADVTLSANCVPNNVSPVSRGSVLPEQRIDELSIDRQRDNANVDDKISQVVTSSDELIAKSKTLDAKPKITRPKPQLKQKPSIAPKSPQLLAKVQHIANNKSTVSVKPNPARRPTAVAKPDVAPTVVAKPDVAARTWKQTPTQVQGNSLFTFGRSMSERTITEADDEMGRPESITNDQLVEQRPAKDNTNEAAFPGYVPEKISGGGILSPKPRRGVTMDERRPPRSVSFDNITQTVVINDAGIDGATKSGNSVFYSDSVGLSQGLSVVKSPTAAVRVFAVDRNEQRGGSSIPPRRPAAPVRSVDDSKLTQAKPIPCRPAPPKPGSSTLSTFYDLSPESGTQFTLIFRLASNMVG